MYCTVYGILHGTFKRTQRRRTWTGDFKCREVKTGFYRNRSMQTGSSGTLIGWKSGQTTFVPLWDWMEGAWLRTLYGVLYDFCTVFCTVRNWYTVIYSAEPRSFCMSLLANYSVSFICNRTVEAYVYHTCVHICRVGIWLCWNLTYTPSSLPPPIARGVDVKGRDCHRYHNSKSQSSYCHRTDPITNEQVRHHG